MNRLPLYADIVERWAIASTGRPAFGQRRDGRIAGRIVTLDDGSVRYQRDRNRFSPAVDELVEIRRFGRIVYAVVDEAGDEPLVRLSRRKRVVPL